MTWEAAFRNKGGALEPDGGSGEESKGGEPRTGGEQSFLISLLSPIPSACCPEHLLSWPTQHLPTCTKASSKCTRHWPSTGTSELCVSGPMTLEKNCAARPTSWVLKYVRSCLCGIWITLVFFSLRTPVVTYTTFLSHVLGPCSAKIPPQTGEVFRYNQKS